MTAQGLTSSIESAYSRPDGLGGGVFSPSGASTESCPGNSIFCFTESGNATVYSGEGGPATGPARLYKRKHTPWMSCSQVENITSYCTAHVFNGDEPKKGHIAGTVPNYSFYTPNTCQDSHDSDFDAVGNDPIEPKDRSDGRNLFMFVFDEDNYASDQLIYAALLGSAVPKRRRHNLRYQYVPLFHRIDHRG
ncbi:hypothetical protein BDK51DRAFT_35208 [Blyttiomyces helicus]|uniref:Uncharacterized protein n=1 Tax=Blyttiomyces helicus TaxID=388810 RepID=A0A4V1IQU7_9FUNG|nr:hypothetical protein BDK51DRAFT_35208 [Blyttiomyces helicus]|eukprot:RKO87797.1 hypothetical protein BDK51DRAFT_35208 [Blyttiomyces helicus]